MPSFVLTRRTVYCSIAQVRVVNGGHAIGHDNIIGKAIAPSTEMVSFWLMRIILLRSRQGSVKLGEVHSAGRGVTYLEPLTERCCLALLLVGAGFLDLALASSFAPNAMLHPRRRFC